MPSAGPTQARQPDPEPGASVTSSWTSSVSEARYEQLLRLLFDNTVSQQSARILV